MEFRHIRDVGTRWSAASRKMKATRSRVRNRGCSRLLKCACDLQIILSKEPCSFGGAFEGSRYHNGRGGGVVSLATKVDGTDVSHVRATATLSASGGTGLVLAEPSGEPSSLWFGMAVRPPRFEWSGLGDRMATVHAWQTEIQPSSNEHCCSLGKF